MAARKRKKRARLRGQRTHGAGNTKNRRGSGCRGGVGRAGSHKHKYSKYYKDFGVAVWLKAKPKGEAINLADLEAKLHRLLEEKKAEKTAAGIVLDGKKIGFNKILGKGSIKEKLIVRNIKVSKNAMKKIKDAGGKIEGDEEGALEGEGEFEEEESGEETGEIEG